MFSLLVSVRGEEVSSAQLLQGIRDFVVNLLLYGAAIIYKGVSVSFFYCEKPLDILFN